MLKEMQQKGFKTLEEMFEAIKPIRWRTKYAWIIVPSNVSFDATMYRTPCESKNIIKSITTGVEYISFDINEEPEELHYFWLE